MVKNRNSLLITLALVVLTAVLSVPRSYGYERMPDGSGTDIGVSDVRQPSLGPTSGEPDAGGGQAPPKVGSGSTAMVPSVGHVPLRAWLNLIVRVWWMRVAGA